MDGIKIPVSLEVLQSSIAAVKQSISNLKPESRPWKELQEILRVMEREADKLQITMSKPFTTQTQFNQAEKGIEKLDEALSKAGISIQRLQFSDLKLTPEQQASFDKLKQELVDIQNEIKQFKANAKAELQNDPVKWDAILKVDPNAATRTFDELVKVLRRKNLDVQKEYEAARQAAEDFQKQNSMAAFTEGVFKKADIISPDALGQDVYDKFFENKKNSTEIQFKRGQKSAFYDYVKENFVLTDDQLKQIQGESAEKVKVLLTNMRQSVLQQTADTRAQEKQLSDKVVEKNKAVQDTAIAIGIIGEKVDEASKASAGFDQRIEANTQATELFKQSLVTTARSSNDFINADRQMQSALESLRSTLGSANAEFIRMQRVQQSFNQMKMTVANFMGFTQVLNLAKRAIKGAINHIKELDSVMNKIAIVTDMSTEDLWQQVDQYSKMAQTYGVTIKGAYEVSQIYYQQGLATNDVLTLTNETLKLAKISGLDYAKSTDYMTTAIRGFKMEMSEAATVVDVYSNLAAHTAVTQEELAVAMSKTASSMEGVGATFEESSAMIATMVAVTRESATNIGSAMKSIASRYGELTKDPTKLVDEDGEAMAFNKVDAALQSVGISMRTVDGQFREFTDVIIELGEKWDQLESTQQRYIATQFAGNRQQSRFLALVSNVDLLKSNLDYAENSEDTGTLQTLKALDSIESKLNQVQVAYQQFYTTIGIENAWKAFLDGATTVINTLNGLPKLFGKLPISAINAISSIIIIIKRLGLSLLSSVAKGLGSSLANGFSQATPQAKEGAENWFTTIINTIKGKTNEAQNAGQAVGNALNNGLEGTIGLTADAGSKINANQANSWYERAQWANTASSAQAQRAWGFLGTDLRDAGVVTTEGFNIIQQGGQGALDIIEKIHAAIVGEAGAANEAQGPLQNWSAAHQKGLSNLQAFGSALNIVALAIDTSTKGGKQLSGVFMAVSGVVVAAAAAIKAAGEETKKIPWVAIASGVISIISGIMTVVKSFSIEARLEEATKIAEDLSNKAKELKANYRSLDTGIKKYKELADARYDSAEAAEEYQNAVEDLAEKFPALISSFDESGNVILSAVAMENNLTEARQAAAEAAYAAARAEAHKAELELEEKQGEIRQKATAVFTVGKRSANAGAGMYMYVEEGRQIGTVTYDNNTTGHITTNDQSNWLIGELQNNQEKLDVYGTALLNWVTSEANQNKTDAQLLSELLNLASDYAINGEYKVAEETAQMVRQAYTYLGWKPTKDIDDTLTELELILTEVSPLFNQIASANKESVNTWIRSSTSATLPFISESSGLFDIAQQKLFEAANGDYSKANLSLQSQKILEPLNTLWATLSDSMQEQVNTIVNRPEQYTASDLQKVFEDAHVDESLIPEWIYSTFKKNSATIQQAVSNKADTIFTAQQKTEQVYVEFQEMLADENTELTLNEQKVLVGMLDQIASINESGFNADRMMQAINIVIKNISGLTTNARNALLNTILTNGLSPEGWKKTLDYINSNTEFDFTTIDTNNVDTIIQESIPNYKLAVTSALSAIEESWTDIDKFFSSASKGINKTEVASLITDAKSLDIAELEATDFVTDGENMVLTVQQIEILMQEKKDKLKTEINNLLQDLQDVYDIIQESEIEMLTDEQSEIISTDFVNNSLRRYQRVLGADFEQYFKYNEETHEWSLILEVGESAIEAEQRVRTAVEKHYQDNLTVLNEANTYYDILFNNLSKSLAWTRGDYSSLLDIGLYDSQEAVNQRLLTLASDLSQMSDAELLQPDIKSAVTSVQTAYDTFIGDVLSKGFNEINLKDYDGLLGRDNIKLKDFKSYQAFVEQYVDYTGKTVNEINELIISAIKKDQAPKSSDILKDLQFIAPNLFKTTLDGLEELANTFGKDIRTVLKAATQSGEDYVVDLDKLIQMGIPLSDVTNYSEQVADSVNAFFDSIVSYIKDGLSGSLSFTDRAELVKWAKSVGIEDLDFTETAEGLKLAETSVIALYEGLKKTHDLKSKLLFDELNKSLTESNEHYKTISNIQEHIIDLTGKLNDIDKQADPARAQQYEQELALAKEILAVRSTEENSGFSFMSRKIPGAQNNPLNYYKDWIKGWNELNDAFKPANQGTYTRNGQTIQSGFIDYESWSALVYEMNNIAKLGGEFEVAGVTLDGSLERAAELIDKGAQSLVSTDSNEIKVALNGMALDFTNGTADFKDGVTKGIQELANSQVEMLDGIIKFLETVVQMEELGEIAGDDGVIDLSDIVADVDGTKQLTGKYAEWIDGLQTAAKEDETIRKRFQAIVVGNKNLWDILTQDANEFTDAQAAAINAVYQAYQSGEYDLESLVASIRDILNSASDEYNVTLTDEGTLLVEQKVQIKEETTYTTEEGTDTTDPLQAVKNLGQTVWDGIKGLFKSTIDSARENVAVAKEMVVTTNASSKIKLLFGEDSIATIDKIIATVAPENVTLNSTDDLPSIELQGIIEEYINGNQDPNTLVSSLHAWIDQYQDDPHVDTGTSIYSALINGFVATINDYIEDPSIGNTLKFYQQLQAIQAVITEYKEGKSPLNEEQLTVLHGLHNILGRIVGYDEATDEIYVNADALESLWGTIIGYDVADGVTTPTPDPVTQDIQVGENEVPNITEANQDAPSVLQKILTGPTGNKVIGTLNENQVEGTTSPVTQAIEVTNTAIEQALIDNKKLGEENPVKQTIEYEYTTTGIPPGLAESKRPTGGRPNNPTISNGVGMKLDDTISRQFVHAIGNVGNAQATGTLLGELGPELVVSNGRYFVAGQRGPEFLDLADDAIVFNHLQTKSLLEKGSSSTRGKAITNEHNAVAYAHGNTQGGPAKASASEALNALIQLRDQWKTLAALTVEDLTKKAGGGGGGGGDATFIKDLERWYNWLQEIAKLEEKINYEEAKRSKMESDFQRNGKDYYQSQYDSLKLLEREVQIQQNLVDEQAKYFNARREALNTQSAFSSLYTFDAEGQIKYASGQFARLSELFGSDATTGVPNHSVKEQYDWLIGQGYGYAMQYNESGEEIKATDEEGMKSAIEAFWAKIEADKTEMQELHDSVEEHKNAVLEKQQAQNEILKAIEDNQISVESKVLGAIEDFRQRTIDEMQKERDAIEKSNSALIKGLQDSLSKERQMYEHSTADKELTMLQRQLAILKRSGGSATEIASLEEQLADKQQDAYFTAQEEQITALQEASDKQLERLDRQIELEEEALEYEKLHGMLWEQVYDVMARSPEEIAAFIKENDSEYWGKSPAELAQNMRDDLFEAEQWKAYAENGVSINDLVGRIADAVAQELEAEEAAQNAEASTTTPVNMTANTNKSTSSGKNTNTTQTPKGYKVTGTYLGQSQTETFTDKAAAERARVGLEHVGWKDIKVTATYTTGGIVPEDETALVHKGEGIFTSEQMSVLRNDILGSSKNSLLNLLQDFRTAYTGLGASVYNNSAAVTIEHAAVHMHVDKLADKYDAADAADDVMQELLTIARKSYASNRIGGKA